MHTFLVPVDFSPASRRAAEFAARLASIFQANLLLFHAYMLPTPVSEVPYVMVTVDDMQKENEDLLSREADTLHQTYGVDVEFLVRIGIASDEVKALLFERPIGLVIMGMKGAGGLDKIIGSTTTNVIRKIKIPVLVVPHDAEWRDIRLITYASDLSTQTTSAIFEPLIRVAKQLSARIIIHHVELNHGSVSDLAPRVSALESIFTGIDHEFVTTEASSVTQGINQYAQTTGSQLLVMVAHQHGFFERMFSKDHTAAMTYETHLPLLILHDRV